MASRFREPFPILQVSHLQRSLSFYRDLLGFELVCPFPSHDEPGFVSPWRREARSRTSGRADRDATASLWLYADDVDAAVSDLREAGVHVVAEPADQPWGERVASVSDPDGHTVHLGARAAE